MKRLIGLSFIFFLLMFSAAAASGLDSWDEVEKVFVRAYENGERKATFELNRTLLTEMKMDNSDLCAAAARAGFSKISWSWWSSGKVEVNLEEAYSCPFYSIGSRDDLITVVQSMREAGADEFVVLADRDLYTTLKNDRKLSKTLLLEGGLYNWDSTYSNDSSRSLRYTACRYWDGTVREADSEAGVLSVMEEIGKLGYDSFALSLDEKTYNSLTASDSERLYAMMAEAFVEGGLSTYSEDHILVFRKAGQSVFYPGYVILRAEKNGEEDTLPERLKETLKEAKTMVSGISGTPEETAAAIHDLLCSHITYWIDDRTEEDDNCIGAILNGKANCDGYSDAFMLLCGLKDIPVRLVHGDALKPINPADEASHMWNLIQMNGTWRGVDVTWDDADQNGETDYIYYNMGEDRMRSYYSYLADFLPEGIQKETNLLDRPVPEFMNETAGDVCSALRTAAGMNREKAILWMSDALYSEYKSSRNPIWKWLDLAGVTGKVSHSDQSHRVTVAEISPLESGIMVTEAGTAEEIIGQMRSAAGRKELRVYCTDALWAEYRGEDSLVWKWLDLGGISGKVSYSEESHRIVLSEITELGSHILVTEADTSEEMIRILRNADRRTVTEVRFYCSPSLYQEFTDNKNAFWGWIRSGGVKDTAVSYSMDRRVIFCADISW